jgi:hypothetical protein
MIEGVGWENGIRLAPVTGWREEWRRLRDLFTSVSPYGWKVEGKKLNLSYVNCPYFCSKNTIRVPKNTSVSRWSENCMDFSF